MTSAIDLAVWLQRRLVGGLCLDKEERRGLFRKEVSGMTDITDMWSYRDTARTQTTDLVGFDV
jgi:hypothetical protein